MDYVTKALYSVLIESDWNLNIYHERYPAWDESVLIESDWNLNYVWTMILRF